MKRIFSLFGFKKTIVCALLSIFVFGNIASAQGIVGISNLDLTPPEDVSQEDTSQCYPLAVFVKNGTSVSDDTVTPNIADQKINFGKTASMLVGLFTPVVAFLAEYVEKLMSNDAIFGNLSSNPGSEIKEFRELLHSVWLIMRDLVNYMFIIVLLAIGFMSVFGAATPDNENFQIKKMLPKFIFAVVAVNFTWFAATVILDAANVVTHVVFALPKTIVSEVETEPETEVCALSETELTGQSEKDNDKAKILSKETLESMGKDQYAELLGLEEKNLEKFLEFIKIKENNEQIRYVQDTGKFVVVWGDFKWEKFQSNSFASLFAYQVMEIQNLPRSIQSDLSDVDIEDLIISSAVALIMMVVIIIAFVVMLIVLLERIVIIWINIIFSPLAALLFVIKDFGLDQSFGEEQGIGFKPFLKYAFLPALMGLPLTIGFILIRAGKSVSGKVGPEGVFFETEIINGVNTIHELLWYILAVAVLWSSVSIAKDTAKHLGDFVGTITDKVKSVGGFVAKLPLYGQFIPVATQDANDQEGRTHLSLAALPRMFDRARGNLSSGVEQQLDDLGTKRPDATQRINRVYDADLNLAKDHASKINTAMKSGNIDQAITALEGKHPEIFKKVGITGRPTQDQLKLMATEINSRQAGLLTGNARNLLSGGAAAGALQSGPTNIDMSLDASGQLAKLGDTTFRENVNVTTPEGVNKLADILVDYDANSREEVAQRIIRGLGETEEAQFMEVARQNELLSQLQSVQGISDPQNPEDQIT